MVAQERLDVTEEAEEEVVIDSTSSNNIFIGVTTKSTRIVDMMMRNEIPITIDTNDNNREEDDDDEDEDEEEDDDEFDNDDKQHTIAANIRTLNKALTRNVRNQSYASYIARSQRNAFWGEEAPLTPEEEEKRKVKFHPDKTRLVTIHIIPIVAEKECDLVWYTAKDYDRFDTESKLTLFRWENHLEGLIKFDENQNSLRGLESHLQRKEQLSELKKAAKAGIKIDKKKHKDNKLQYIRSIIKEMNRQKSEEGATAKTLDWDKLREVGLNVSRHNVTVALQRAASDELERKKYMEEETESDSESDDTKVFGTVKVVLSSVKDRSTNNKNNNSKDKNNKNNIKKSKSNDDLPTGKESLLSSSSSSKKNPLRFFFQKKSITK